MSTAQLPPKYIPYSESVELGQPDEQHVFQEIAATMRHISETMNDRARHAARSVHAKSHGLLCGELHVYENLSPALAQGLFAKAAIYPVILRFSTNPGDMLPDSISTPRGLGVKVIGVEGQAVSQEHEGQRTQDFVMVNGKAFGVPGPAEFLKQAQLLEKHAADSEGLKQAVSTTARIIENVVEAFGGSSDALKQFGHPQTHVIGETFYTQVPLRYGDYIAKICIAPLSANLAALTGKHVDLHGQFSGLRDSIVEFFRTQGAEWEVRVQLNTNLETMPIEDASKPWPEDESPYIGVGRIAVTAQEAYSPARRVYVDEQLTFNPWHALAAHKPLGGIMRARRLAYELSSKFRHSMNGRTFTEPKSISELPE